MNEQQAADLFSAQLDRMLQGKEVVLPADAGDLQELLGLGQQFTQFNFQANPAVQATFQSQLVSWFGPNAGRLTILGIPKGLFIALSMAVIMIGTSIGLALIAVPFLGDTIFDSQERLAPQTTKPPASAPLEVPELPVSGTPEGVEQPDTDSAEVSEPEAPPTPGDTIPTTTSSMGDTIPKPSLHDSVPSAPFSLGDTIPSVPPSPTATDDGDAGVDIGDDESISGDPDDSTADSGDTDSDDTGSSAPPKDGSDDRGHGNEPDGYDQDNPGKSGGLPDKDGDDLGKGGSQGGSSPGRGNEGDSSGGDRGGGDKGGGKEGKK
jgi:hypothetical protein